jgi:hypothetical protein
MLGRPARFACCSGSKWSDSRNEALSRKAVLACGAGLCVVLGSGTPAPAQERFAGTMPTGLQPASVRVDKPVSTAEADLGRDRFHDTRRPA